jgi:hypothetical protein
MPAVNTVNLRALRVRSQSSSADTDLGRRFASTLNHGCRSEGGFQRPWQSWPNQEIGGPVPVCDAVLN